MKCKTCDFEEINTALYCSDCGSLFYAIYHPSLIYARYGEFTFDIEIENKGDKNLKLLSTQLNEYKILNDRRSTIGHNQSQKFSFSHKQDWDKTVPLETVPSFELEIGGEMESKKIRTSFPVFVCSYPEMSCKIQDVFRLSPYTGLKGSIEISVNNESRVIISGFRIEEIKELQQLENEIQKENQANKTSKSESILDYLNTKTLTPEKPQESKEKVSGIWHYIELEKMIAIGQNSQKTINFSFPSKNEYGKFRFRISPVIVADNVIIEENTPSCKCSVEYSKNPIVGFAIERWTVMGFASIAYLEANHKLIIGDGDIITPSNFRKYNLSDLDSLFAELSQNTITLNIPIGEPRIRRIKPITFCSLDTDPESLINDFPCQVTIRSNSESKKNIKFRETPHNVKENQFINLKRHFHTINESIFLDNVMSADWLELLFTLEDEEEFSLEVIILFPYAQDDKVKYGNSFIIKIIPYHPKEIEDCISIDFGTTNSCIAMVLGKVKGKGGRKSEGDAECLSFDFYHPNTLHNTTILPTILSYELLSVNPVEYIPYIPYFRNLPAYIASNFKIDFIEEFNMGKPILHPHFNKSSEHQITDFFQVLLERIKIALEDRGMYTTIINNLFLTVPNAFSGKIREKFADLIQQLLNRQTGRIKQISVKTPQDEALVVINYALENHSEDIELENNTILGVFDFGGGTTDITFICILDDEYILLSTGGSVHFGGSTIDSWILARLQMQSGIDGDLDSRWDLTNLNQGLKESPVHDLNPELLTELSRLKWHLGSPDQFSEKIANFIERVNAYSDLKIDEKWKQDAMYNEHLVKPFFKKFKIKIASLITDALGRALDGHIIKQSKNKPKLILFLAGNGSKIFNFEDYIRFGIDDQFKDQFTESTILPLSKPKEAVALGARAFENYSMQIDRKTCGPSNSYYYGVPTVSQLGQKVKLDNGKIINLIPIILEGDAQNSEGDTIIKEFFLTELKINPATVVNSLLVIEKSGIDYNNLKLEITGRPPYNKIRFILNIYSGILLCEGVS